MRVRKRRALGLPVLLLLMGSLLVACGGEDSTSGTSESKATSSAEAPSSAPSSTQAAEEDENWNGETAKVKIPSGSFEPGEITISKGTKVEWTNEEAEIHNVVISSLKVQSKPMGANATFSHVFDKPGTYDYVCAYHSPEMAGKVIVE